MDDDQPHFIRTAFEKAGLLVTMGNLDSFAFLGTSQEITTTLAFKSGPYESTSQYKAGALSVQSGATLKTLWHIHLYIGFFSVHTPLDKLHQLFEILSKFIAEKGIHLDHPLMISSGIADDSARFILYHHLYTHFKTLVEKESKDQTDDQIADKVLQNNDIQVLLEDRQGLIKKLLNMNFAIHSAEHLAKYRELVLQPMIRRVRQGSADPSKQEKINKKLEMLAGFKDLLSMDPDQSMKEWDAFITQMQTCYEQLIPICSNSSIDSYLTIWGHICEIMPLSHCHHFYKTMIRRAESDQICRLYRDFTSQKLREQGYLVNQVNKEGRCVLSFHPTGLLKTLQAWYEAKQPDKAHALQRFLEDLEQQRGIDNPDFEALLMPLSDLEKGGLQFDLLETLIIAYEKEPTIAVKDYLKKVLIAMPDSYINHNLMKKIENSPELLVLMGECLTTADRAYCWLGVLYKEPIGKYGSESDTLSSYGGLDPAVYSRVKSSLIRILSHQALLVDIIGGNLGRVAIACMWLQIDEEILLQAAELLFNSGIHLDQFIPRSALPVIWKKFASDPMRIQKHPQVCDQMLELIFKIWFSAYERRPSVERRNGLQSSEWATLQEIPTLPLLKAAYQAAFN
ncbi:MAG: hypothetical protein JSS10_07830 [Verrucomicrobia bacterium]|nr:hypothetical protein [Verrucomicrobiota bacterium]